MSKWGPPWRCPWCGEIEVAEAGQLCGRCSLNPDASEFKEAHDRVADQTLTAVACLPVLVNVAY